MRYTVTISGEIAAALITEGWQSRDLLCRSGLPPGPKWRVEAVGLAGPDNEDIEVTFSDGVAGERTLPLVPLYSANPSLEGGEG